MSEDDYILRSLTFPHRVGHFASHVAFCPTIRSILLIISALDYYTDHTRNLLLSLSKSITVNIIMVIGPRC